MKKITYLLAFLSITATFTHFEYLDSLSVLDVVETQNIDASYMSYETQTEIEKKEVIENLKIEQKKYFNSLN